jgi:Cu(I)/Ag(I) efflux system membrane protein CusA/SilA
MKEPGDVVAAVREGALDRLRPKMMTVTAIIAGLVPILWSHGTGADVMKRIASPMVGGMLTSTLLTLVVLPAIYLLWRRWQLGRRPDIPVRESLRGELAAALTSSKR